MTHQPLRAMLYFLAGLVLFAWMDTTIKYLSGQYPPPLVVAVRYVVHFVLMVAILAPSRGMAFARTQRTTLVVVRGACLAAGSLLFALALKRLPVAEASAIIFAAPLLVMLMASMILKEQIGRWGWTAAIAGFCGLLLIARPGGHLDGLGVTFAAAAAVVLAIYQLMSRTLARTESTLALLFWTALIGAVAFGAMAPWFWAGGRPSAGQMALFLSTGALAGIGHYLFTAAHRYAPASDLAPFQYIQLLWAGLFGYWTFGHVPDGLAIVGMIVVAASGAVVALKSQLAARTTVRAASA